MDATGIEPMTSSLQGKRATNCAMCPQSMGFYGRCCVTYKKILNEQIHTLVTKAHTVVSYSLC